MPKSIFTSKTFWFNVLMMGLQALPGVAGLIPQPWGAVATGVGNLVLRAVTNQPVVL